MLVDSADREHDSTAGVGSLFRCRRRFAGWCGRGGFLQQPRVQLAIGYGWAAGSISLLNNIWVTYNYPFFIAAPLAAGNAFVIVQMIFLVWNSINDPIFGWLSDASVASTTRQTLLLRAAPFFALSFVIAWIPWSDQNDWLAALHFLFSLSFYDGALTFLEVNYSALLADITTDNSVRTLCNSAAAVARVVGSLSTFFASMIWVDGSHLSGFRVFAFVIAILSIVGFQLTASQLNAAAAANSAAGTAVTTPPAAASAGVSPLSGGADSSPAAASASPAAATVTVQSDVAAAPLRVAAEDESPKPAAVGWWRWAVDHPIVLFWGQLLSQRNFAIYAVIKFLQVFSCTFEKNHLAPFLFVFVTPALGGSAAGGGPIMSGLIFASFVLPQLLMLAENNGISQAGIYPVIRQLFGAKLALPLCMLLIKGCWFGSVESCGVLIGLYLIAARVITECVCRLFPLVASDLIDEDRARHTGRSESRAGTLVGTASLFAKPGESLAPILGWKLLSALRVPHTATAAGAAGAAAVATGAAAAIDLDAGTAAAASTLATGGGGIQFQVPIAEAWNLLFPLVVVLPLVLVLTQFVLWSYFYTLKGTYLQQIKSIVEQQHTNTASASGAAVVAAGTITKRVTAAADEPPILITAS